MQTLQTEKKITFNEVCFGLSYDGRNLYTVEQTGIACVDLLDDHVRITSVQVNVDNVFYLSVNGDNLDYADKAKDTVICCQKKNGAEVWSFKNEVMEFPNGITSDQYGNTYVACAKSNNVLIIKFQRMENTIKKYLTRLTDLQVLEPSITTKLEIIYLFAIP